MNMGNSSTKEQRSPSAHPPQADGQHGASPAVSGPNSPNTGTFAEATSSSTGRRELAGRHGRPDFFSSLGMGAPEREQQGFEWRKETKQEREARRLERERVAREKERERSMREEHVDGGFLVTLGTYTGIEDYNKSIVRQLMIERRLAPFWKGLNDHQESWTENQLVAAAKGLPIPPADEIPLDSPKTDGATSDTSTKPTASIDMLTVPMTSRAQSFNSDESSNPSSPLPSTSAPPAPSLALHAPSLGKSRSKTLASLTSSSRSLQPEPKPREINLPNDPLVHGQRLEAQLYKDVSECPICFLYYPPHLNKTRCCDQAICSECFVQIKRPDPHPPEHADPSVPPPPPEQMHGPEGELISEPATCPFCKVPEFGITYDAPPFRRGLAYANHPSNQVLNRAGMSSTSSLGSTLSNGGVTTRRRNTSVSANSPMVITTDQVRPDWAEKLATARAHTARRSAAATALHTAAYLMGNRGQEPDLRSIGFGRRGLLRRTSGGETSTQSTSSSQLGMLALMSERSGARTAQGEPAGPPIPPGGRESSRRNRIEDLEDMMMMEAIRLSLASEEERRKREEKEAKKETKKKEKEDKKAAKAAKRTNSYPTIAAASASTPTLTPSESSLTPTSSSVSKDKSAQRNHTQRSEQLSSSFTPQSHLERARLQFQIQSEGNSPLPSPGPYSAAPHRPSHLRTQSNVSSNASGEEEERLEDLHEPEPDGHGQTDVYREIGQRDEDTVTASARAGDDGTGDGKTEGEGEEGEGVFNFGSLAAIVRHEDDTSTTTATNDPTGEAASHDGGNKGSGSGSGSGKTFLPEPKPKESKHFGTETEGHVGSSDGAVLQGSNVFGSSEGEGEGKDIHIGS